MKQREASKSKDLGVILWTRDMGAGGFDTEHGLGILNKKWKKVLRTEYVSERITTVLKVSSKEIVTSANGHTRYGQSRRTAQEHHNFRRFQLSVGTWDWR